MNMKTYKVILCGMTSQTFVAAAVWFAKEQDPWLLAFFAACGLAALGMALAADTPSK